MEDHHEDCIHPELAFQFGMHLQIACIRNQRTHDHRLEDQRNLRDEAEDGVEQYGSTEYLEVLK